MAIGTSSTQCGNGPSATSSTTWTLTTTAALAVGEVGVLRTASDNISSTDGDNNEIVSVTGGTGTWDKLSEYTNANGGAALGVTISAWVFTPSGTNAIGTVFTVTLASARTQKIAALEKWTVTSGNSIRQTAEAAVVDSQVDAGGGFGSSSYTGLTSLERLYLRVLGAELSTTASVSPTASFTALSSFRSSTSSPVAVLGEFRVNTSTGETSNPAFTPTADKAGMFFALEEYTPGGGAITGTAAITLGAATVTSGGSSPIAGTSAITLGTLASSSQGSSPLAASAAVTLGTLGLASQGALRIAGAAGITLGAVSLSSTGSSVNNRTGQASITFGAMTAASAGSSPIRGQAAVTLGGLSVTSTGTSPIRGQAAVTLGSVGLSATATNAAPTPRVATASITFGALTSSAAGGSPIIGQAAVVLGGLTLSATGGLPVPPPVRRDGRAYMTVLEVPRGELTVSTTPRGEMRVPTLARRPFGSG